jgi:PIN domain nuclease of toxin-antitoxin system
MTMKMVNINVIKARLSEYVDLVEQGETILHHDPFDRLLVCQAIVHGVAILTPDPLIVQYPARVIR